MLYFLLPFVLLVYFELIGRLFFLKIKREPLDFSFVIGLSLVMAILYILSWPITAFNGDFYHLASLYILLFILSILKSLLLLLVFLGLKTKYTSPSIITNNNVKTTTLTINPFFFKISLPL